MSEKKKTEKRHYMRDRLKNNTVIKKGYISDKNIFGMSNTAVSAKLIKQIVFNENVVAIDWFLFSDLLWKGAKAVFTDETTSFYRQHRHNDLGI
ncbi:MAG: hypothetical protein L7F78_22085, partial [Syntrophales bacterium LBB04]|nr:hypothetical protein [Syntrophales bacterium LBB04]